MSCSIPQELIEQCIAFHGHSCPGLSIGIRAAEYAQARLNQDGDAVLVCVTETDMCGVDAIQFLTDCTVGKGNMIHRDYGKMAFSFFDRRTGAGVRLLLRPEARQDIDAALAPRQRAIRAGQATAEDEAAAAALRAQLQDRLMTLPLEELFAVQSLEDGLPRPAAILASLVCAACGEQTMESRTRRFGGQTLCIPCFNAREQKI
ncbi:FmdE family protein [Megalodesulfovibrio gigas]|uniref:Putative formylmethanofuran dehydrogenase subunit E n=1 Tax=Megalodesulfovibrio gigas (strain ATCC 19364 / DSM 1382 / NCIMB 9332 / VKM B-1759) TaxID=1121448 RepID=T2G8C8_MEGG1|nr:FmdE family protein [Megalodesulfovibrio gigas]AGW12538.1 putative formylmethanofuran dehydrogenase subunit E [Megalodesulfovibrio gigas DSM 1382 = ATCC 19364]